MAASRFARVMACQYKAAVEADHPNLIPLMSEADMKLWHFLICNLPEPFASGEYLIKLEAPENFPQSPPSFSVLTENGVYEPGGKICISVGDFHTKDFNHEGDRAKAYGWRPALGMWGFAREAMNGMIVPGSLGGGIRVIATPDAADIRRLAGISAAANRRRHPELVRQLAEFEEANPGHKAVALRRMRRASAEAAGQDRPAADLLAAALGDGWPVVADVAAHLTGALLGCVLGEWDMAVRAVLVHALNVSVRVAGDGAPGAAEAIAAFLEVLPGVCGGASAKAVPEAVGRLLAEAPASFPELYAPLAAFLSMTDIDAKAKRGLGLARRARLMRHAAAKAGGPAEEDATAAAPPAPGAAVAPEGAGTMDDYIDSLLDD